MTLKPFALVALTLFATATLAAQAPAPAQQTPAMSCCATMDHAAHAMPPADPTVAHQGAMKMEPSSTEDAMACCAAKTPAPIDPVVLVATIEPPAGECPHCASGACAMMAPAAPGKPSTMTPDGAGCCVR